MRKILRKFLAAIQIARNLAKKHHGAPKAQRVGIFLIDWPLQNYVANLILSLTYDDFDVDLILYNARNLPLGEFSEIEQARKVRVYDLSYVDNETERDRWCARLLEGIHYTWFIGVEKKGLILAEKMSSRFGVPLIYHSLELYLEGHPDYTEWHLRPLEKECHRKAVATIIQDPRRGEVLCRSNGIEESSMTMLYLPVSVRGGRNPERSRYLRDKFGIADDKTLLLYFGQIEEGRFCLELARAVATLDHDVVLVFHGYFPQVKEKEALRTCAGERLILSLEMVPVARIPEVISSADIGLALYRNDCLNDRLTAFSSEKVAYFMQSGIPIISFKNESFDELYEKHRCGEGIEALSDLLPAIERIKAHYQKYRAEAFDAFECYYSFEKNYANISHFFRAPRRRN